ncbi:MAG TPA: HD domain-containing protein [bacterium]|jgi:GTP pyrophosphokinase
MKTTASSNAGPAGPVPAEQPAVPPVLDDGERARLERLKQSILRHYPRDKTPNIHLLEKAFADAEFHHRSQRRKSGEAYIFHPVRVSLMVAEAGLDVESVIIALLHDVIEDTEVTKEEMRQQYGDWLAEVVDGLTKAVSSGKKAAEGRQQPISMETYRKLISSTLRDLRTVQVKLFDRLDNMRDLGYLPRLRQRRIASETMNVYVPMAQRLGMQVISDELTALSFRYLYPKRFKANLAQLKQRIRDEEPRMGRVRNLLETHLKTAKGLKFNVVPLYRQISDFIYSDQPVTHALMGFRVRVATAEACYQALGALHMHCRVVPNSIKDYISNPKPNRYQALQSEVFIGSEPALIEVVSDAMEKVNASGILAGWQGSHEELHKYYQSYLELLDLYQGNDDLRMEDVLRHAQMDTLQMFTPKGQLLAFPQGATVLDFAFAIHSDLGLHCDGAYMGGRRVSRFEELSDGEMVEVLTRPAVTPQPAWLDHVRTTRSKLAIRRFLKAQANARAQEVGRKLFAVEVRRLGWDVEELTGSARFQAILAERGQSLGQIFQLVGVDKLPIRKFLLDHQLVTPKQIERLESEEGSLLRRFVRPIFRKPDPVLKIQDLDDGFIHMAECCTPLLGDPIVGVQGSEGITIHRTQCPTLERVAPDTLLNVGWDLDSSATPHRLHIRLVQDRPGLLYKVSKVMRDAKVNILDIGLHRDLRTGIAHIRVDLEPMHIKTFRTVVSRLRNIKEVERISLVQPNPAERRGLGLSFPR